MTELPAPTPETYWGEPGKLLAGPYPGAHNPEHSKMKLARLLEAGVDVFLDLTQEGEAIPYASELRGRARHQRMSIADFSTP